MLVNGKITAITQSRIGRSTKLVPRYVLDFEDRERTQYECGYDEVEQYNAAYKARIDTAATSDETTMEAGSEVGSAIYTMWTRSLNRLAGGGEPPKCKIASGRANGIWIRKCKIAAYHNALRIYELHYTCGYIRYVTPDEMHGISKVNEGYKNKRNPKLLKLLGYAETEWDQSQFVEDNEDHAVVLQEKGSSTGGLATQTNTTKDAESTDTAVQVQMIVNSALAEDKGEGDGSISGGQATHTNTTKGRCRQHRNCGNSTNDPKVGISGR